MLVGKEKSWLLHVLSVTAEFKNSRAYEKGLNHFEIKWKSIDL